MIQFERDAVRWGNYQRNGFLRAFADADAASHTDIRLDLAQVVDDLDGLELTVRFTNPTANTKLVIHGCLIPGRGQHGSSFSLGLDGSAAARTAVADGVKPAEHRVFEESVMDMPAGVFILQYLQRFGLTDSASTLRMVIDHHSLRMVPPQ